MSEKRAIILGAGGVGLISAWKLLEEGWRVDVYEATDQVGGMCKTWKWGEYLLDTGPHIYHTPDENLSKFWESEFGDLFIQREFWCKNVKGDDFKQYWDYPLSWESISRYPKELKDKVLGELHNISLQGRARATNYTEYMDAQVGPTLREMFFKKFPEKIWGISTNHMATDWAPKRIEVRQKVTPFYHKQWNAVGKYGAGCIFERIKEKVLTLGGNIHFNHIVSAFESQGNAISAIEFSIKKSRTVFPDEVIISSLAITDLARFLGYESKLDFRALRTVYLAYDKEMILPKGIDWLYYDSEKTYFSRITEPKKLSPYVSAKDKTYLTLEITCSKDDEIYKMEGEKLVKKVAEQVELVGLAKISEVAASTIHSEDHVYPIQHHGYQEELSKTRSVITSFQQIYSLGTGGEFHYSDIQILFHKAFDLVATLCNKGSNFTQTIRKTKACQLNSVVSIRNREVGFGRPAYIIAEAGLNHNGSIEVAKQLIDRAKESGADAIKFQTFKPGSRISKKVKAARYAETIIGLEETLYDMFDRLAMGHDDQKDLFNYARKSGIEIFSTPFDLESAEFLNSLGVGVFKIASMDLVSLPFIKQVARMGKPMILSTGMSTLGQVEEALEVIRQQDNPNVMLLHCNSSYPAAQEEMNLQVIETLKKCFKVPVGLSDHTFGLFVSHTALVLGADLIERHFTLDRAMEGPDHILSSAPAELAELVSMSKKIPEVLGDGIKRIQPNEYDTLNTQRKSLYAACDIKKGTVITQGMVAIKGPGGGLLPKYFDLVAGRIAKVDIEEDHPITWEAI
ncbi:MAG: N-acetylneuraminate synthase family protein [Candidatus Omnitrophica bacterium]|nr:N-acetylneuraminate synthase family protein [Candidatus Omnitrophota bacterium]